MATEKFCPRCNQTKPATAFWHLAASPDGLAPACKACLVAARKQREAGRTAPKVAAAPAAPSAIADPGYIASRDLLKLWTAVQKGAGVDGPDNLMFLGPSGCGKTAAGSYLADLAQLPFTKVDAAAMTDPESWFGTREVVAVDGVSVTTYRPSEFVQAIQRPGVVLIDEINRIRDEHRNILLPLTDGTRRVTNPLTGDVVQRHAQCYFIMSGNRGFQFTGTYAVDPALMTRSLTVPFSYLASADEIRLVRGRYGVSEKLAGALVRFANESRARAQKDQDFAPISTREVLLAAKLVANTLDIDLAVQVAIINGVSDEGGSDSQQTKLTQIWTGIRPTAF